MSSNAACSFGSLDWFTMVEEEIRAGIRRYPPEPDFRISFVERYHGADLHPREDGLMWGLRIDISGNDVVYRIGVSPTETADIVIDANFEAVRVLATMPSGEAHDLARETYVANGQFRVNGTADFGRWSDGVHDAVYRRTV